MDRTQTVADVVAGYEALMQRLADTHAPEFLEIPVTMPQAKLLYLLGALGDMHMSELVGRLGVSLSTVSELVDRVVDQGLVARHEDPRDRRQVVVGLTAQGADFLDRFRELNARQLRDLLARLDDAELENVRDAVAALARAAGSPVAATPDAASPGAVTSGRAPGSPHDPVTSGASARKDPA